MMAFVSGKTKTIFEAQFMKKLSNTGAELEKSVAYKKKRIIFDMVVFAVGYESVHGKR